MINPILAFKDNYIWAIPSPDNSEIIVVDPGDAKCVIDYLQNNNINLHAILLTHHHWDHSGGILALCEQFPLCEAYGSKKEKIKGVTHFLEEGDSISFFNHAIALRVLEIPGHTLGHIAFVGNGNLFCGDTLFSGGCGRVFEGTPEQMVASLNKLKALPKETKVFCGHEYTVANLRFAHMVEPENTLVKERLESMITLSKEGKPTLPSTISIEIKTNPFLRCDEKGIIQSVQRHFSINNTDFVTIFSHLREWKNSVG